LGEGIPVKINETPSNEPYFTEEGRELLRR